MGFFDSDSLSKARKAEESELKFYLEVAEKSKSLLADVVRAFAVIAKKTANRSKLSSLLKRNSRDG